MQYRILFIPFAVLAMMLAFVACGGDDDEGAVDDGGDAPAGATDAPDEENGDGGDPAEETESEGDGNGGGDNGGGPAGRGTATLVIGDETWEFAGIFCAFSTEVTENDSVPFTVSGGEFDGTSLHLDASVVDLSPPVELSAADLSVSLNDIEDFENPTVDWGLNTQAAAGGAEPVLEIDGSNVHIEGVFDNDLTETEFEAVPGTLDADCP